MQPGSLTAVGTGIQLGVQLTPEARVVIERADVVLSLVAEPVAAAWLVRLNPRAESLERLYQVGRKRAEIYAAITDEILRRVREDLDVCVATYGHPGIFVTPLRNAIRQAEDEGYRTRVLPGISAEDCLFADLGVDPFEHGCQSYDATEFLVNGRRADPTAGLVLWQVGTVGNPFAVDAPRVTGLPLLVETLLESHPRDHIVIVYEAAPYPGFDALIRRVPLGDLGPDEITGLSTLYVPPSRHCEPNRELLQAFGF